MNFNGIFFVSSGFFCRNDPDAAFLGFANFSFSFSKSLFCINTSPLTSISSGKSFKLIFFGISLMVARLAVISSPSFPSPLDSPILNSPFLYINDAEMPSIFGSALYCKAENHSLLDKKFNILFSKLTRSSLTKCVSQR
jgi:hypothetical protein